MRYVLLVYESPGFWDEVATEEKRAHHRDYHAVAASPVVSAHYRLGSPTTTTTLHAENGKIVKTNGPLTTREENVRALYLAESDDQEAVLELAARIPAARAGGAVEVWSLLER
jgi:hypothetical protein